jgi:hypothetical protein
MIKNETTMSNYVYVATKPVNRADKRGNVKVLPAGTVIKATDWAALPSDHARAKFTRVERSTKKVRWSGAELDLLVNLYLTNVDPINAPDERQTIIAAFCQHFPKRTGSAVVLGIAQIKALDAYHPAGGMTDTSAALVDRLYAADPVRFPGGATREEKVMGALDLLLAEVLAG